MTSEQIRALACAYLDLVGAFQAFQSGDMSMHDWKAHELTIEEFRGAFLLNLESQSHIPHVSGEGE